MPNAPRVGLVRRCALVAVARRRSAARARTGGGACRGGLRRGSERGPQRSDQLGVARRSARPRKRCIGPRRRVNRESCADPRRPAIGSASTRSLSGACGAGRSGSHRALAETMQAGTARRAQTLTACSSSNPRGTAPPAPTLATTQPMALTTRRPGAPPSARRARRRRRTRRRPARSRRARSGGCRASRPRSARRGRA